MFFSTVTWGNDLNFSAPHAEEGVLDLSNWDFEKDGSLNLNGKWEFYWEQLLGPDDFRKGNLPQSGTYIDVPEVWNNHETEGGKASGNGYATYRLIVRLGDHSPVFAFKILDFSTAYTIWVNGKLLTRSGKVGTSRESMTPYYNPGVFAFTTAKNELEIIVQVSNFFHRKGGLWRPITLGTEHQVQKIRERRSHMDMFMFGAILIMALYHFVLYFLRKKDPAPLFFGIFCAVNAFRTLLTGEQLIVEYLPGLSWELARKFEYFTFFLILPSIIGFVRAIFPDEIKTWLYKWNWYLTAALCLVVVVTPIRIYSLTTPFYQIVMLVTSCYAAGLVILAGLRKKDGAWAVFGGAMIGLLTVVNDILYESEIIHTGILSPFGTLGFILVQSYILSARFSNAFITTEIYANTFQKFVPVQFLNRIAKQGIGSIRLGNVEKEYATILFSDIRSFTTMSEDMEPGDIFNLLNEYLSHLEPSILEHDGFVDKYLGDAIMAIFISDTPEKSAANAVAAAMDMRKALAEFNELRKVQSKTPVLAGTGIHGGEVMIGTVGGVKRMDSTAIGDAVNVASRIEGLTKVLNESILISDDTARLVKDDPRFQFRFVQEVLLKGKKEEMGIWTIE